MRDDLLGGFETAAREHNYDPVTGRYTLAIMTVLRLVAGLTALVLGGALFLAFRRERRPP